MKLLFFPKYSQSGASSRYRTFQYLPYMKSKGIYFEVYPLFSDAYIERLYSKKNKIGIIIESIIKRIYYVLKYSKKFDLLIIEKEVIPFFPAVIEKYLLTKNIPYILDYDDAIFHNYDLNSNIIIKKLLGKKIEKIISWSKGVITGSHYLENFAKKSNKSVTLIPTVINLEKYPYNNELADENKFVIGWIGSPSTSDYIMPIIDDLIEFCSSNEAYIHLIGFDERIFSKKKQFIKIIRWNENTEIIELKKITVGIMPLENTPWSKGKCGFKLIQYMGCSKPVLASNIGENKYIVDHGKNGYLVNSNDEWKSYLNILYKDRKLLKNFGINARIKIEERYSLQVMSDTYIDALKTASKNG